jgi:hypothetical protein
VIGIGCDLLFDLTNANNDTLAPCFSVRAGSRLSVSCLVVTSVSFGRLPASVRPSRKDGIHRQPSAFKATPDSEDPQRATLAPLTG